VTGSFKTGAGGARYGRGMHADATFEVTEFTPSDYVSPVTTGSPVGHAHMVKQFTGELAGRSTTQFSYAFDDRSGVGTYVALEAFEGTLDGRSGAFAFAHSATTDGQSAERLHELMVIAPGSGSGELAGITGTGAMVVDDDGTHRVVLDYEIATSLDG
jgi:hypothetical protein